MAVIAWTLLTNRPGTTDEKLDRKYRKEFLVQTNSLLDGPLTVRNAALFIPALPRIGQSWFVGGDIDLRSTCRNIQIDPYGEDPFLWKVVADYDTKRDVLDSEQNENPLLRAPDISWTFAQYERVLTRDITGVSIVNSSKEAFDPPITVTDSRPVLTVKRNEPFFNPALALAYQDAVNQDIFAGAFPRQSQVQSISGIRKFETGFLYWEVTYEVHFRRETFDLFILDQGFRDKDKKLFRDPIDMAPLSNPTLLNGLGKRLTDGTTTLNGAVTSQATTIVVTDGVTNFPPGPTKPPHWYFEVKVDDEIMQVIAGHGTNDWTVNRAYAGTNAANHDDAVSVKMEPYYLRFLGNKVLPFSVLRLPAL